MIAAPELSCSNQSKHLQQKLVIPYLISRKGGFDIQLHPRAPQRQAGRSWVITSCRLHWIALSGR